MTHYADNLKKSIVSAQGRITQMIHDDIEKTNAAYREAIIRLAREADSGFEGGPDADGTLADSLVGLDAIERFAALVAAAEREACARACEPQSAHDDPLTAWKIAATIRARGEVQEMEREPANAHDKVYSEGELADAYQEGWNDAMLRRSLGPHIIKEGT